MRYIFYRISKYALLNYVPIKALENVPFNVSDMRPFDKILHTRGQEAQETKVK